MNNSENPYIYDVSAEQFNELVIEKSNSIPVVVIFWMYTLPPSRIMMNDLESFINKNPGKVCLAKVNTEEVDTDKIEYSINLIELPTVMIFSEQQRKSFFEGINSESDIEQYISLNYFNHTDE